MGYSRAKTSPCPLGPRLALRLGVVKTYLSLNSSRRSWSAVARQHDVKPEFVKRWVTRFEQTGTILDAPRSGAPMKLDEAGKQRVASLVREDEYDTATRVAVGLGGAVSPSTVRRTLHSMGFEYKNLKWQTRLTQRQVQRRLKFARKHRDGGPWSKTSFTDVAPIL